MESGKEIHNTKVGVLPRSTVAQEDVLKYIHINFLINYNFKVEKIIK